MNPLYTPVADRAIHRCEYCHVPEIVLNFPFEVEHILSLARGGTDNDANLALACRSCNLRKGTRTSGIDPDSATEAPFLTHDKTNGMTILVLMLNQVLFQVSRQVQLFVRRISTALNAQNPCRKRVERSRNPAIQVSFNCTLLLKTPIGRVTIAYLGMNSQAQTMARQLWLRLGLLP